MNNLECPVCKIGDKLVTDLESGEIVCSACGTVATGQLSESRGDFTENPASGLRIISGAGPRSSLAVHDMNLSTMMGKSKNDTSGQMSRLRNWDLRTQFRDSSLRNYRSAFSLLNNLKNKLAIPDSVVERTAYNYRKIERKGFMRSRPIPSVLAACLYLTCREMGIPRTMDEIHQVSNVKKKQLARDYREMVFNLELNVPPVNYFQYLEKISSSLRLDERISRSAMSLMQNILDMRISAGKDPMGLAAAVLYVISEIHGKTIKQADFANVAGITEVTLRKRSKDIKGKIGLIY